MLNAPRLLLLHPIPIELRHEVVGENCIVNVNTLSHSHYCLYVGLQGVCKC